MELRVSTSLITASHYYSLFSTILSKTVTEFFWLFYQNFHQIVTILNYYFTDEDNCIIVEMSEIKIFILSTSVGNK